LFTNRVIERQRPIQKTAFDLSAFAILQSAAASSVAGIFEVTVSTAARIATFGFSRPSEMARSIAFWQI